MEITEQGRVEEFQGEALEGGLAGLLTAGKWRPGVRPLLGTDGRVRPLAEVPRDSAAGLGRWRRLVNTGRRARRAPVCEAADLPGASEVASLLSESGLNAVARLDETYEVTAPGGMRGPVLLSIDVQALRCRHEVATLDPRCHQRLEPLLRLMLEELARVRWVYPVVEQDRLALEAALPPELLGSEGIRRTLPLVVLAMVTAARSGVTRVAAELAVNPEALQVLALLGR